MTSAACNSNVLKGRRENATTSHLAILPTNAVASERLTALAMTWVCARH